MTRLSAFSEAAGIDRLTVIERSLPATLDPRLQLAVLNRQTGKRGLAIASTGGDEVAVVARVKSVEDWEAIPDVHVGSALGAASEGYIVTGRIPVGRIEAVHDHPSVLSISASQPIRPNLAATIDAMRVGRDDLPKSAAPAGGAGVVVGVVDFGCDFNHANFRLKNGKTRIAALWHQAGAAHAGSPFGYGRLYTRDEIDAALGQPDPYGTLGYGPPIDSPLQRSPGTHGTHVMDIAVGNGFGTGQPGVAPDAEIVFVEASTADIPWEGPNTTRSFFGDSVQLLEAVRFIFDFADGRPCVVNLSLGTNGGPHDGSSLVEQGLDSLLRDATNRAIVIAAGNSQDDSIHTSGTVPPKGSHAIVWQHQSAKGGEFELWYPGARRLRTTFVAPDGTRFDPVEPGATLALGPNGKPAIFISSRLGDRNNGDNAIGIWVAEGIDATGSWSVELESVDGEPVDYHAWIERDDYAQGSFAAPVFTHTLGSISTGHETVVVGSYNAHKPGHPLSYFSSAGPTRDGREKPEVSAPGQDVQAARSRTKTGMTRKSGTSMAAPAVSGLIALMLAEAKRKNIVLNVTELRTKLLSTVLQNPPTGSGWHDRYGMGRATGAAVSFPPKGLSPR